MTHGVSVVAAVITPANRAATAHQPLQFDTRVLLSQRRPGKHLAGCWEFPGGRVEPGETEQMALQREVKEELGITVHASERWCTLTHRYPEKTVSLKIYRVTDWSGVASGLEGQAIEWVPWHAVSDRPMPPADRALLKLFGMAPCYLMDQASDQGRTYDALLQDWQARLAAIAKSPWSNERWLVQWTGPYGDESDQAIALGRAAIVSAQRAGHVCLVGGSEAWARCLGADGVVFSKAGGMALTERPRALSWAAMACDDPASLQQATELGLDFVLLSPLRATKAQPMDPALGGGAFEALVQQAGLPVIAVGGLGVDDLAWVRSLGGFGVASRAHWPMVDDA